MSFLDLDPRAEENAREQRQLNPVESSGAGLFEGSASAPLTGLAKGSVIVPSLAVNLALSAIPRAIDAVRGTDEASDWWHGRMTKPLVRTCWTLEPAAISERIAYEAWYCSRRKSAMAS